MKTKVLTVLSATVASVQLDDDWNLGDTGLSSAPTHPYIASSSLSTQWTPPANQDLNSELPICYELEEKWLLVKQPSHCYQPRVMAAPSSDRLSQRSTQPAVVEQNGWVLNTAASYRLPACEWNLVEWPLGSHSSLTDTDSVTPSLVLDQAGQYKIRFAVRPRLCHPEVPAPIPAVVSDLLITTAEEGVSSVAIALSDFTISAPTTKSEAVPYLFLVAVYAGLTTL